MVYLTTYKKHKSDINNYENQLIDYYDNFCKHINDRINEYTIILVKKDNNIGNHLQFSVTIFTYGLSQLYNIIKLLEKIRESRDNLDTYMNIYTRINSVLDIFVDSFIDKFVNFFDINPLNIVVIKNEIKKQISSGINIMIHNVGNNTIVNIDHFNIFAYFNISQIIYSSYFIIQFHLKN